MARYRIIERPSFIDPTQAIYDVEERTWLQWWQPVGSFDSLQEAKKSRHKP